MKRILVLTIACLLTRLISAQKVTEADYYPVINASRHDGNFVLINQADTKHADDIIGYIKSSTHYSKNSHSDTLFNADDLASMQKQFDWHKNYTWQATELTHAKLITETDVKQTLTDTTSAPWEALLLKYGQGAYYHMSIPLFSVNKKLCALYADNYCGHRCGSGNIVLYYLKNGRWVYLQSIPVWDGSPVQKVIKTQ